MHSTANAMWLLGETVDNEENFYYHGHKVVDILQGVIDVDENDLTVPAVGPGHNSPSSARTIDYLLSTTSKYRYNKAIHCIWGHEEFEHTGAVGSGDGSGGVGSLWNEHVLGRGGNISTDDETHNPNNNDYSAYPEKRIQTLKNKVVTFFLSTQEEGDSPYENIADNNTTPDEFVDDGGYTISSHKKLDRSISSADIELANKINILKESGLI